MSKNRRTGHDAERDYVDILAKFFGIPRFRAKKPNGDKVTEAEAIIGTARQFSRTLDNRKIDVWINPKHWLSKFFFQIKKTVATGKKSTSIDIQSLFEMQPPDENGVKVLVTRIKRKPAKTERHQAWVVTLLSDDFLKLLNYQKLAKEQHLIIDELLSQDHLWDYDKPEWDEEPHSEVTREFHQKCNDLYLEYKSLANEQNN